MKGGRSMTVAERISIVVAIGLLVPGCGEKRPVSAAGHGTPTEGVGQRIVLESSADIQPMKLEWIGAKADPNVSVQAVEELLFNRTCTYESRSRDLIDGQTAEKSLWWAVYPSLKRDNESTFPIELKVEMDKPIMPHPNPGCSATMDRTLDRTLLRWKTNEPSVPPHFGGFGYKTKGVIRGVEIRRQCRLLGDGRAQITITVQAPVGLLIRVWGLHGAIQVEPESIRPENHRLSENGALFFDYGRDWQERGIESEYSFVISGLKAGQLYYPHTNALERIQVRSPASPAEPVTRVRGYGWGFDFTLGSDQAFSVGKTAMRASHLYELQPLWTEQ